jgi:hypothetical protein
MPAGKGVGPSVVGRLVRDRSVRLAAGLAITVAIPVAIMFYFQFRSLSDLGRASAVVLRQLSQETADAVTKDLQDALRLPRTEVLLKIFQYQTEPLDLPFIQTTFSQGLDTEPFVDGFYVWSEATTEHRNDLLSFDRDARRFVTNPPETALLLGQFRAMAPAQRAIAVFEAPLIAGSDDQLRGAAGRRRAPARDLHPAAGRQAARQGRGSDRLSAARRHRARQRSARHLSGRWLGAGAVRG